MATIETNPNLGAQIVADAKEHVLYSWSVQSAINPIPVAGAEGRYFWDYDGKRYLDFASQLVNVSIGHQHPKIIAAIKEQADKLCTIGPPMANESRSQLGRMLSEVTPGDLSVSFFTNGGAEANENAVKLARMVTGRHKIIARYRSYHGATHGAVTLTGDPRRWAVEPGMAGVVRHSTRTPTAARPATPTRAPSAAVRRTSRRSSTTRALTRRRDHPRDGDRHQRRHRAARRLFAVGAGGVRPPRHSSHPRRGDGRIRPHRPLVRMRALGRRAGHHHRREGDQLRLRAARRHDRARPDRRPDPRPLLPRRPHLRRASACLCVGDRVDRGLPRGGNRRERRRHGRVLPGGARGAADSAIRRSATSAASVASGASSWSRTATRARCSCRSTRPAKRRRRWRA